MEENHEILTLADFWLDALLYLANELHGAQQESLLQQRDDLAADWRAKGIADAALAAVVDAAERLGRRLVLMVENLQDPFGDRDEGPERRSTRPARPGLCSDVEASFTSRLHGVLRAEPRLMLIATATAPPDETTELLSDLHPQVLPLEPLDTADCRTLWKTVAGIDVADERMIRPLQILTGGSPRLLAMMATLPKQRLSSLPRLIEGFVALLDEHTEYFRGRIEALPMVERRVFLAVVDMWEPSSPADISARARIDIRTVSAMLGRLAGREMVSHSGSGRKRLYSARERLFCFYYLVRRDRERRHLVRRNRERTMADRFLDFMSAIYPDGTDAPPELRDWVPAVLFPEADRELLARAISAGLPTAKFRDPQDRPRTIVERLRAFAAGLRPPPEPDRPEAADRDAPEPEEDGAHDTPEAASARAMLAKAEAAADPGDTTLHDDLLERFSDNPAPEIQEIVARALLAKAKLHERRAEAIACCDSIIERFGESELPKMRNTVAEAYSRKGMVQTMERRFGDAGETFRVLLERFVSDPAEVQVVTEMIGQGRGNVMRVDVDARAGGVTLLMLQFVEEIPDAIGNLAAMKSLTIAGGRFPVIPDAIGNLGNLTKLSLWGDNFTIVPDTVWDLTSLENLYLKGQFARVPDAIGNLTNLTSLQLDGQFAVLPNAIGNLTNLEVLSLGGKFTVIPEAIGDLVNLGELSLRGESVVLPDAIVNLTNLKALSLYGLASIPKAVGNLANLMDLLVWGEFNMVPDTIGDLTNLQRLDLMGRVAAIPDAIGNLASLKSLTIAGQFLVIPDAVGNLASLETLRLTGQFSVIPDAIGNLAELTHLALQSDGAVPPPLPKSLTRLSKLSELKTKSPIPTSLAFQQLNKRLERGRLARELSNFRFFYSLPYPAGDPDFRRKSIALTVNEAVDLIAGGASDRDVLDVLTSDDEKSAMLLPLVVALQQRSGESVAAPPEVAEVADDIIERIDVKQAEARRMRPDSGEMDGSGGSELVPA